MSLFETIEATWPPASTRTVQGVTLRDGKGGGKRVSAASAPDDISGQSLDAAIAEMDKPLFQVRGNQPTLDEQLGARGFQIVEPVTVLVGNPQDIAGDGPDKVSAFRCWPPLAIQRELWAEAGIGPARLAVMDRACTPKLSLLGRINNQPAGACFVAISGEVAMLHALEVSPRHRRSGCARNLVKAAALWAVEQGAAHFATLTLRQNAPAQALFASFGMTAVEHYHYRSL